MALAFYVDKPDSLSSVFAAHDEYLAVFSYFLNGGEVPIILCRYSLLLAAWV